MAPTPYSKANASFSLQAHEAAKTFVYPFVFNVLQSCLSYRLATVEGGGRGATLDGERNIDCEIRIDKGSRRSATHDIQFRFRRWYYHWRKDVTITEWNNATDLPSELQKIRAGIFVYGYFYDGDREDQRRQPFFDAVAFHVSPVRDAILNDTIPYHVSTNPRSQQSFVCVRFERLHDSGHTLYWQERDNPRPKPPICSHPADLRYERRDITAGKKSIFCGRCSAWIGNLPLDGDYTIN